MNIWTCDMYDFMGKQMQICKKNAKIEISVVQQQAVRMFLLHKERKSLMLNVCQIKKKEPIMKNLSETAFPKVSPNSTTHKVEHFYKAVWGLSACIG